MMALTYDEVTKASGAVAHGVDLTKTMTDLTVDSRNVKPGALFVALPGAHTDGHKFVPDVWAKGGVAMVEASFQPLQGPALVVPSPLDAMGTMTRQTVDAKGTVVVAVTGSVGKTSVKELTAAALGAKFATGKSHGNYNTAIGLPMSYFRSDPDITHFVAEMGMRALGEIAALTQIMPPQVAIITNIGPNHMETLGSMDNIQRAKGEILLGLRPGGIAVLNYDDDRFRALASTIPNNQILWYGRQGGDCVVKEAVLTPHGTLITLEFRRNRLSLTIPYLGAHHGHNVAAAFLAAIAVGLTPEEAVRGLESVPPTSGRLQTVPLGTLTVLADYYNASPLSMTMALDVLAHQPATGRKIAVLGDMLELGVLEEQGHEQVGQEAARRADIVLAVGPRSQKIAQGAQALGSQAVWVPDLDHAYDWLIQHLQAGDVMLLKASHGMMFETLHQRLEQWGGPH
ncbi:UDP-N-acetylmuramoyl-tripeptide--D-alanyl-D-alanine ligase [Sulfobacillus sp. hq2]|uniref:UDP-N-acetylmuramoyl-tripeptide--D-alanyl-D- alanine ligase n=1 Tax=Sulfobacillus TaxID=28033 RepID=UPI000CD2C0B9|nr:UDP-N-acetylmuramoyl-tripeptide--D-alanyl-D-alanine ligase [Sulfobacillus sp. hq2]POB09347.1 UDP-N-acetylmuramoyl-tripeptide--D-alanyl-D-alanine ligase [Sulfobacillus sp. hq2]